MEWFSAHHPVGISGEVFEESGVWNVLPQECPHTSLGYVGTIQKAKRGLYSEFILNMI